MRPWPTLLCEIARKHAALGEPSGGGRADQRENARQAAEQCADGRLLSENSILFPEIVDQILLVTIQPAGDGEDEEVQRMGHLVRLSASVPR